MELVIDRHFRGPTESANGGYTCGVLASLFHGPVEVTLRLPPPLERPLELDMDEGRRSLELRDGDALVAEAEPTDVDLELPEPVAYDEAADAALPLSLIHI